MNKPTIVLRFDNLVVIKGSSNTPLPLTKLDDDSHIHGGLRFQINGRTVPYTGYFGADDACFGAWLQEFAGVYAAFAASETARYVYDEGEQGQPAFVFERRGDTAFLSIVDSELSDGVADPDWQWAAFDYADLCEQYLRFQSDFMQTVRRAAPNTASEWLERNTMREGNV